MLAKAQMRGYGGAGPAGQEGLLRVVLPRCEPGPNFDACQPDLNIRTGGVALGVVAFIGVAGDCLRSIDSESEVLYRDLSS